MPETHRSYLLEGMKDWAAWVRYLEQPWNTFYKPIPEDGEFAKQLYKALDNGSWKKFRLSAEARADLANQVEACCELLKLPEPSEELVDRLLHSDCIERWFNERSQERWRRNAARRRPKQSK